MDISVFAEPNAQTYINETNPKHSHKHTETKRVRETDSHSNECVMAMEQGRWKQNVVMLNVAAVFFLSHWLPLSLKIVAFYNQNIELNSEKFSFFIFRAEISICFIVTIFSCYLIRCNSCRSVHFDAKQNYHFKW